MKNKVKKICFASSSGGHLEELLMLRPLMERYDSFIVTEKTAYEIAVPGIRCYYLQQVNRRERACMRRLIVNAFRSLKIFVSLHDLPPIPEMHREHFISPACSSATFRFSSKL